MENWRKLGLGLKYCSATQQSFCKWTFVDVLRLCRSPFFLSFFLEFIFEHFERIFPPYLIELPPLLGASATSESSCWDLASSDGSSLTRPLFVKEQVQSIIMHMRILQTGLAGRKRGATSASSCHQRATREIKRLSKARH